MKPMLRLTVVTVFSLGFAQVARSEIFKVKAVNLYPAAYGPMTVTISRLDFERDPAREPEDIWMPIAEPITFKKDTDYKLRNLTFDTGFQSGKGIKKANRIEFTTQNGPTGKKIVDPEHIKEDLVIEIGADANDPIKLIPASEMKRRSSVKKRRIDVYKTGVVTQPWTVEAKSADENPVRYGPVMIKKVDTGLFKKLTVPLNQDFYIYINNKPIKNVGKNKIPQDEAFVFKTYSEDKDPVLLVHSTAPGGEKELFEAEIMTRKKAMDVLNKNQDF